MITLSLLERAEAAASEIQVVGTRVTREVAGLMRCPPSLSEEIFDNVAAFYVVKERGFRAAVHDLLQFRRWATRLDLADTLVLEKKDTRNRLLTARRTRSVIQVPRELGAYADREQTLRPFLGELPWLPCTKPSGAAHRLLINPSARAEARVLPISVIDSILRHAEGAGTEVCLIDVDGRYKSLQSRVHTLLRRPSLADAAMALAVTDRYVGPDSFFMHLAYYFRIPFLAFFWPNDMYFAPPGMLEQGNYIYYPDAQDKERLDEKLRDLIISE